MSVRTRRIIRNILGVAVALVLVFFLIGVPWFIANLITTRSFHFHDANDGKTPASYGLSFHDIEFRSPDGIPLKGWYVPGGPNSHGVIVYCHGRNRTRVEMLPMAVFAHGLGYDGLLFDLRHSGASGGSISTLGYQERLDAIAAVHYALENEHAARPVVIWGVSMGAAAALMAAADSQDVTAVISDSSFLSFRDVIIHHAQLYFHLPAFPIVDEGIAWAAWRGGFRPSDFDLRKAIERMNPRPVLFIAVQDDRRIPPAVAQELYSISNSPQKTLVIVPGRRHGEGFRLGNEQYEQAVKQFLAALPH